MKVKIKLNYEQKDQITLENLQEKYIEILEDISRIENQNHWPEMQDYELQDYNDWIEQRLHFRKVIEYFMVADDFLAWQKGL